MEPANCRWRYCLGDDSPGGDRQTLIQPACRPPHLRPHITLGHALKTRINVLFAPQTSGQFIERFAVLSGKVVALAGKANPQDAIALLSQCKAYCVGVPISGNAAATGVPEIAPRFQFVVTRPHVLMAWGGAGPLPSCTQGKTMRKRPV